ncbi:MAG: CoA transferase [Pigmentiphaga sp.]|nr:CoA transferase [Pigmentiphaga sp.]
MRILDGIRVLDLGSFITAPLAGMLLGELGADVIKVEKPGEGDPFRAFKGGHYSPQYQAHNRNKRSLTLDVSQPDGRSIFDQLVATADVVLLNMRPGVEARLGLDYERLRGLNPGLVYCAITGFGASGPYAGRPAYDNVGQAVSGWLSLFHEGRDPRVAGPAISDALAGMHACIGILGALVERSRTQRGRKVEVSMLEAMIATLTEPLGSFMAAGQSPGLHGRAATSQSFVVTCRDGLRLGLHLSSPRKFWQGLLQALEAPELDTEFPDRQARIAGYDTLCERLAERFAQRDRAEWEPRLAAHDVPFAPENQLADLPQDPQVRHLNLFYQMQHPRYGTLTAARRALRYDGNNDSNFLPPPGLGEHTDAILAELGLDDETLSALRRQQLI